MVGGSFKEKLHSQVSCEWISQASGTEWMGRRADEEELDPIQRNKEDDTMEHFEWMVMALGCNGGPRGSVSMLSGHGDSQAAVPGAEMMRIENRAHSEAESMHFILGRFC